MYCCWLRKFTTFDARSWLSTKWLLFGSFGHCCCTVVFNWDSIWYLLEMPDALVDVDTQITAAPFYGWLHKNMEPPNKIVLKIKRKKKFYRNVSSAFAHMGLCIFPFALFTFIRRPMHVRTFTSFFLVWFGLCIFIAWQMVKYHLCKIQLINMAHKHPKYKHEVLRSLKMVDRTSNQHSECLMVRSVKLMNSMEFS